MRTCKQIIRACVTNKTITARGLCSTVTQHSDTTSFRGLEDVVHREEQYNPDAPAVNCINKATQMACLYLSYLS